MKSFLIASLFLLGVCTAYSQTGKFEKLDVQNFKLNKYLITNVSNDENLASESSQKLVTEQAVKKYIDKLPRGINKAGGGITIEGDSIYFGGFFDSPFIYYLTELVEEGFSRNLGGIILEPFQLAMFLGTCSISLTEEGVTMIAPDLQNGEPTSAIKVSSTGVKLGHYYQWEHYDDFIIGIDGTITIPGLTNPSPGFRVLQTDNTGKLLLNDLTQSYIKLVFNYPTGGSPTSYVSEFDEVVKLPDIIQNTALSLPDPAQLQGKSLYLFNENTTSFKYTLNHPIYKSGNTMITEIPGNTEFGCLIVSDGSRWLRLTN